MRYLLKPISIVVVATLVGANVAVAGGYYDGHSRDYYGYKQHGHRHKHKHGDVGLALGFGLLFGTLIGYALSQPRYGYDRPYYLPPRSYRRYGPSIYDGPPRYQLEYRRPSVIYREYHGGASPRAGLSFPGRCLQEREFQTRVIIDGREVAAYGTACLQPDGSWRRGAAHLVPN